MSGGNGFAVIPGGQKTGSPGEGIQQEYRAFCKDVAQINGTKQQTRARWLQLDNAGTREKAEWPSGANIKHLTLFCTAVAGTTALVGDEYVIITIDALTDAAADANLTQTESATNDVQWIPIPINKVTEIPLMGALTNGSLSGGRIDAKTVGGIALDLWIGAN